MSIHFFPLTNRALISLQTIMYQSPCNYQNHLHLGLFLLFFNAFFLSEVPLQQAIRQVLAWN